MERPDLGELSREEEDAVLALRAAAMEGEEEMAMDDVDIDDDARELIKDQLPEDEAKAVAADIELNRLRGALAASESRNAVMSLHIDHARASERDARIDALIKSGRIGTTDGDRALACLAYDTEAQAVQSYAIAKGVSLATAALAQSTCRLFSDLEGKAAGAANVGLASTSVGGKPYAGSIDASIASAAGMQDAIKKAVAGGKSYTAALAEFRTSNPGEYAAAMEG